MYKFVKYMCIKEKWHVPFLNDIIIHKQTVWVMCAIVCQHRLYLNTHTVNLEAQLAFPLPPMRVRDASTAQPHTHTHTVYTHTHIETMGEYCEGIDSVLTSAFRNTP